MDSCCVVTGGAQGIGKIIARVLLDSGYTVVIADNDREALDETLEELDHEALHGTLADVGNEEDVIRVFDFVESDMPKLCGIVNNAGISCNVPVTDLDLSDWMRVINTNLTSVFLTAKYGTPLMDTGSAIVNIASTRALMSEPDTEAYSASKGGIVSLTHSLAVSLGPRIRVNAVSPGWIDVSGMKKRRLRSPESLSEEDHLQHPAGRAGRAEDIALMVRYLLSADAEFITGEQIVIDGGMTRKMIYC